MYELFQLLRLAGQDALMMYFPVTSWSGDALAFTVQKMWSNVNDWMCDPIAEDAF